MHQEDLTLQLIVSPASKVCLCANRLTGLSLIFGNLAIWDLVIWDLDVSERESSGSRRSTLDP